MLVDEREVEYERLCSVLNRPRILAFAQQSAAMAMTLHEPSQASGRHRYQCCRGGKLAHLEAVASLAVKYVGLLYYGEDQLDRRYVVAVCEAAAYLHETMSQSRKFEEIVAVADEAVARVVAAVTPDLREPPPKRIRLLANQIGLASREAQVVSLADLRHEYELRRQPDGGAGNADDAARWPSDAIAILGTLRQLTHTPLDDRVLSLRRRLIELDRRLKDRKHAS